MSSIIVRDLALNQELDSKSLAKVRGGTNSWMQGLGPVANVNVNVSQNIAQLQSINVNTLNNVGVIGSGLGLAVNVNPAQWAATHAAV
ncbi:hypothetical protein ACKI2N_011450 [Cupriavidus sp. 30B13]|uniref:hypothetical protein n=1 Tax=Cupriavidus sp. 30B13 TaxID=3384241 RepID=UPI003B91C061